MDSPQTHSAKDRTLWTLKIITPSIAKGNTFSQKNAMNQEAIERVMEQFGNMACKVFKTVTGDNGSEFSRLSELVSQGTKVYFTHPYSSWEKGTNECHNKLLRRFIRKGASMTQYSAEDIAYMADWANALPRKILGYRTPDELFEAELDRIYAR